MFYFEDITEDLLFIACAIPPFLPCYCCSHCPYPRFASPPCNAIPLCNVPPPPPIQHPPSRCSDVSFVPYYPALPPAEGCTFFFSVQLLREEEERATRISERGELLQILNFMNVGNFTFVQICAIHLNHYYLCICV